MLLTPLVAMGDSYFMASASEKIGR
jgi:hypothetical protein